MVMEISRDRWFVYSQSSYYFRWICHVCCCEQCLSTVEPWLSKVDISSRGRCNGRNQRSITRRKHYLWDGQLPWKDDRERIPLQNCSRRFSYLAPRSQCHKIVYQGCGFRCNNYSRFELNLWRIRRSRALCFLYGKAFVEFHNVWVR